MRTLINCFGLATVLFVAACVPNNQSIQLLYPVLPAAAEGSCSADGSEAALSTVEFDVDAKNGIGRFALAIQNNMTDNADETSLRLNSMDFLLEQAVITYEAAEPALSAAVAGVTSVQPLGQTIGASSTSAVFVDVLPQNVALSLAGVWSGQQERQLIRANVRIDGKTLDGHALSSNTLPVIVSVCGGCLLCGAGVEPAWNCASGVGPVDKTTCP